VDSLATASYHDHAMSDPAEQLDRFYLAHRRCGALTSGLYGDDAVWISCSCGSSILVPAREEDPEPDLEGASLPELGRRAAHYVDKILK